MRHSTAKRPIDEYISAIDMYSNGSRVIDISNILDIPHATITNWINGRNDKYYKKVLSGEIQDMSSHVINDISAYEYLKLLNPNIDDSVRNSAYSFIFGLYLGDGCLDSLPRTYKLGIYLDNKYVTMNNLIANTFNTLFGKRPSINDFSLNVRKSNGIAICHYHKKLDIIFPQKSVGRKHTREISINEWQSNIIQHVELVKGLIYSDGCYFYCKTNNKYAYSFSNASIDISNILRNSLDFLGIAYTTRIKKISGMMTIEQQITEVLRKEEVNKLHKLIGDKNNPI